MLLEPVSFALSTAGFFNSAKLERTFTFPSLPEGANFSNLYSFTLHVNKKFLLVLPIYRDKLNNIKQLRQLQMPLLQAYQELMPENQQRLLEFNRKLAIQLLTIDEKALGSPDIRESYLLLLEKTAEFETVLEVMSLYEACKAEQLKSPRQVEEQETQSSLSSNSMTPAVKEHKSLLSDRACLPINCCLQ